MPLDLLSFLEYSNYNFRASNLLCQERFIAYAVNMCILFTYSEGQTFVLDRLIFNSPIMAQGLVSLE